MDWLHSWVSFWGAYMGMGDKLLALLGDEAINLTTVCLNSPKGNDILKMGIFTVHMYARLTF